MNSVHSSHQLGLRKDLEVKLWGLRGARVLAGAENDSGERVEPVGPDDDEEADDEEEDEADEDEDGTVEAETVEEGGPEEGVTVEEETVILTGTKSEVVRLRSRFSMASNLSWAEEAEWDLRKGCM